MNEDQLFSLMADALDGMLSERDQEILDHHLATRPDLAEEWLAMQQIDQLFRAVPALPTPVYFAERTLALLPDSRTRRILMGSTFLILLLLGIIPVWGGVVLYWQMGSGTAVVDFGKRLAESWATLQMLGSSFVSTIQLTLNTHPYLYGWLFLMLGVIGVWASLYWQLIHQVRPIHIRIYATA